MNDPVYSVFQGSIRNRCERGQVLVRPDEQPRGVFLLLSGYVKAYDIAEDGSCQIMNISRPGALFPIKWAIEEEDGNPLLFYEAMCDSEFIVISKQAFHEELAQNPQFSRLQLNTMLALCRAYEQRVQNHHQNSIQGKLAFHLLFLQKHFGHVSDSLGWIDAPITYQDIADSLNTSRETVNRGMRQFIEQGMVAKIKNRLAIKDISRLQALLNGEDLTLGIGNM